MNPDEHRKGKKFITGVAWAVGRSLFLIAWFLVLFTVGLKVGRFLEIDTCLDLGGRWDYERDVCDYGE